MAESAGYKGNVAYKAGAVTAPLADYTDFASAISGTLTINRDNLDTTPLQAPSGMRTSIAGLGGGSMSIEGNYYNGDTAMDALIAALIAGDAVSLALAMDGTNGYAGSYICTSVPLPTTVDGLAKFSAELTLSGPLTALT